MDKQPLTVRQLENSGFKRAAVWKNVGPKLLSDGLLPKQHGVYAFSIGDIVMYVGLASQSLANRLYFYGNPGSSQSTNIRLNALLLDALKSSAVSIHVATPPDFTWNGLTVRGAEGLESGIIRDFDLPWNRRGNSTTVSPVTQPLPADRGEQPPRPFSCFSGIQQSVHQCVDDRPGMTEAEIAQKIFGKAGYQQKVNPVCRSLARVGKIRRVGIGGASDPYRYWPSQVR